MSSSGQQHAQFERTVFSEGPRTAASHCGVAPDLSDPRHTVQPAAYPLLEAPACATGRPNAAGYACCRSEPHLGIEHLAPHRPAEHVFERVPVQVDRPQALHRGRHGCLQRRPTSMSYTSAGSSPLVAAAPPHPAMQRRHGSSGQVTGCNLPSQYIHMLHRRAQAPQRATHLAVRPPAPGSAPNVRLERPVAFGRPPLGGLRYGEERSPTRTLQAPCGPTGRFTARSRIPGLPRPPACPFGPGTPAAFLRCSATGDGRARSRLA